MKKKTNETKRNQVKINVIKRKIKNFICIALYIVLRKNEKTNQIKYYIYTKNQTLMMMIMMIENVISNPFLLRST